MPELPEVETLRQDLARQNLVVLRRLLDPLPQQLRHEQQREHQHDVERQHVYGDGTESQEQRLDDGHVRLLQKIHDSHLFRIEWVLETGGDVGDFRKEDGE